MQRFLLLERYIVMRANHWYEEDGVIYCHNRIEFSPYIPNAGTCDRMEILLALMYKYPDKQFAVEIMNWFDEATKENCTKENWQQECNYLRENGIDFYSVKEHMEIDSDVVFYDTKFAILTAEQLNSFPVYEKAGY